MLDNFNLLELALVFLAVWMAGCVIGHVLYKGGQRVYSLVQRRRQRRATLARLKQALEAQRLDRGLAQSKARPQAWQQARRPQTPAYDGEYASTTRLTSVPRDAA